VCVFLTFVMFCLRTSNLFRPRARYIEWHASNCTYCIIGRTHCTRDVINRPIYVIYNDASGRAAMKPDKMENRMQKHYAVKRIWITMYDSNIIYILHIYILYIMYIVLIAALRRLMLIILTINTIYLRSELCRLKCVVISGVYVSIYYLVHSDDRVSDVLIKNILQNDIYNLYILGLDSTYYIL